jgi:hypothetical protein
MTQSIWLDRAYSRPARQLGERAFGSPLPSAAEFARGGPFPCSATLSDELTRNSEHHARLECEAKPIGPRTSALDLLPRGGGNAADAKHYPIVFDILLPIDEGLGSTSSRERRRCRVRSHTCTTGRLFSS